MAPVLAPWIFIETPLKGSFFEFVILPERRAVWADATTDTKRKKEVKNIRASLHITRSFVQKSVTPVTATLIPG